MTPALTQRASIVALSLLTACHQQLPVVRPSSSPDSVNVGYGAQPRQRVGGAVLSLSGDTISNLRVRRVEELLAGRYPGVTVIPTPGGFIVRIRGGSSLPNREPLYVVDGLPVEVNPERGLDWLEPSDIERIDILRDPAETSMFGGRGANGVVVIRTKIRKAP